MTSTTSVRAQRLKHSQDLPPLILFSLLFGKKRIKENPPKKQGRFLSADCKKGPAERGHVKKRQKVFRHFSTIFAQGKKRQNRRKVSKSFSTLFDNFRAAPFFRPLLQSADSLLRTLFLSSEAPKIPGKEAKKRSKKQGIIPCKGEKRGNPKMEGKED